MLPYRFRLIAERDETLTGLGDFVVIECEPHTTSLHERHLFPSGDVDGVVVTAASTSSEAAPARDASGKFAARPVPRGVLKEVYDGEPIFVPEEPTVIDDVLYLRSGFAVPLLPSKRDSGGTAERIRPKRRNESSLSHKQDAKWDAWETRMCPDGERPAKRQRIRGAGGEDALRAWGWVRGLGDEQVEADEPEPVDDGDVEGLGASAQRVQRDDADEDVADVFKPLPSAGSQLSEQGSSARIETARLRSFGSRPDIVDIDPTEPPTKSNQQPPSPFPARSRFLAQNLDVDDLSEAMSRSFSIDFQHDTPETSFSPTSPAPLRPDEATAAAVPEMAASIAASEGRLPPSELVTIKREEADHAREQLALEALVGLSGLLVEEYSDLVPGLKAEEDGCSSAQASPEVADISATAVDEATVPDVERKLEDLTEECREPAPPTKKRSPRKLSRWELPGTMGEEDVVVISEPGPTIRDDHEQDEKKPLDEATLSVAPSPSELPSKASALTFVPRSSKKPAGHRALLKRPTPIGATPVGDSHATSFSSPQKALMAIAQASKANREADLLERARAEQMAAVVKAEPEATEEEKLAAEIAKEQRQAEDLQHLFWKSGGQNEGGKIDR